jgi:hypothetical protein
MGISSLAILPPLEKSSDRKKEKEKEREESAAETLIA